MKIAVDAMGGDYAPQEIVKGALKTAKELEVEIILVGDSDKIRDVCGNHERHISIVHSTQVIGMEEKPAAALRKKRDSSIGIATKLVKDGQASALVSAGSTGAQMTSALMMLGRIPDVKRPALVTVLPAIMGPKLVLDVGANTDCCAENLVEFGIMGSIYAGNVLGIKNPKVGLLNIGTEETKGNKVVQQAYELFKRAPFSFCGNVEARDIFKGEADVVICDGFVGNSIIKFGEGLADIFYDSLREAVNKSVVTKLGGIFLLSGFRDLRRKLDWEEYGGAPLLGVNGVSVICHGSSKSKAISSAVKLAKDCVENDFVANISATMAEEKVRECQMD